jgi:hypothetical protein
MTNELTPHEPGPIDDDGFHGSLNSSRSNNYLKWTAAGHWVDRDGITPPSPLLVFAIDEALRMWKDSKPTILRDKPLPDRKQLNDAIPQSEWERGNDGQLREPWEHIVIVRLVNFGTGEIYKYEAARRSYRLRRAQGEGHHDASAAWCARDAGCQSQRTADENQARNRAQTTFRNHRLEDPR